MPSKGREHFDEYAPQTAIKHAILDKYFRAYLTALGRRVDAVHYIDGFAGQGSYGDGQPGSPLRAVAALAELSTPASVSLVESDRESFAALELALRDKLADLVEPLITNAEFSDVVSIVLTRPIYRRFKRVATFAFIDPCGVRGVRLSDIGRLLGLPLAECLVFWNYDGVNRWIGGVERGTHSAEDLTLFFGGDEALRAARECFRAKTDVGRKEAELCSLYVDALRHRAGARFIVPFRFQARDKARTSHYLFHCSNHPVAFKIMKEVMWGLTTEGSDSGAFEFLHGDHVGGQASLFDPGIEQARAAVLQELTIGNRSVNLFTEGWVVRPEDLLIDRQYRKVLLDLEAAGLVEILDPRTGTLKPSASRIRAGAPTLAAGLLVRLVRHLGSQREQDH